MKGFSNKTRSELSQRPRCRFVNEVGIDEGKKKS